MTADPMEELARGMADDFGKLLAEKLKATSPIYAEFDAYQLFVIVGQLQLALKHPENVGESAEVAEAIAEEFSALLIKAIPEIEPVIAAGWIVQGVCRVCGCTEASPCVGGCSWVEEDLCSKCRPVILDPMGLPARG